MKYCIPISKTLAMSRRKKIKSISFKLLYTCFDHIEKLYRAYKAYRDRSMADVAAEAKQE